MGWPSVGGTKPKQGNCSEGFQLLLIIQEILEGLEDYEVGEVVGEVAENEIDSEDLFAGVSDDDSLTEISSDENSSEDDE